VFFRIIHTKPQKVQATSQEPVMQINLMQARAHHLYFVSEIQNVKQASACQATSPFSMLTQTSMEASEH